MRNEEVYKIFDFETGRGFQPDFLLLLNGTKQKKNAYFQVFIEPKGKPLAGDDNDGWKEKFLLDISKRYGITPLVVERNKEFMLIGLPFFNEEDQELKAKFEQGFNKLLKVSG